MSVPIINVNQDVVVFRDPVSNKADTYRWWAERGLIHWENANSGEYGSQTVRTTLDRLKSISEMIGNSRTGKGFHRPDEVRGYQEYVDKMILLCEKANSQGMPDNAQHSKQKAAEWKAKRQSKLVVVSGLCGAF